jgi:hypothetical protein
MSNVSKIKARAKELNYNLKRSDASRAIVLQTLAIEFMITEDEILAAINYVDVVAVKSAEKPQKAEKVDNRPVTSGRLCRGEEHREIIAGDCFIVTSAQNNTPVHADFIANLEAFAKYKGAKIIVMPFLYNKNGFQNGEGQDEIYYDASITKYLQRESVWLGTGKKVAAMAFNILPTVKSPLGGMREAIGSAEALIIPHATIAHECVPVLNAQYGRVVPALYSTGTITQRNYIQQQAGHKAENRHNFGVSFVEFNEHGQFWVRQIETDESGNFQDLLAQTIDGQVFEAEDVSVINWGDIHAEKIDENVAAAQWSCSQFDNTSMIDALRPKFQMMHDLLDFEALNHHNRENHFHIFGNKVNGASVSKDLHKVLNVLEESKRDFCHTIVVRSNHDDALDRWLADGKYQPRLDPVNALLYYKLQTKAYEHIEVNQFFDSLPISLKLVCRDDGLLPLIDSVKFLRASQSFIVGGVELGEHGHSGTNGSRGSPKQFAAMRMTTGHTHSPSIFGGCYTAGVTGKLAMGYNETGASSWQHAVVVQYANGFRTIVHIKPVIPSTNDVTKLAFMA